MNQHKFNQNWQNWFTKEASKFLLFAKQQSRNSYEAEDILQDSLVKLLKKSSHKEIPEDTIVYKTIRNLAIDYARSNIRRIRREEIAQELEGISMAEWFENDFDKKDRQKRLEKAIKILPDKQQEVIILKIWGEQTFDGIAEILNLSANTVASRYRYGLQALHKSLNTKHKHKTPNPFKS